MIDEPYRTLLAGASECRSLSDGERYVHALFDYWATEYCGSMTRPTNINRVSLGTFEYAYDDLQTLEAQGIVARSDVAESRLVGVAGFSAPAARQRDDHRLRGWVGPTARMFGNGWDKGHFIAHTIGGAVDGFEANVFVQRRDLNRGWSQEGRAYRDMERHCASRAGILCFSRPIYTDETARPTYIEFGFVDERGEPRVQRFDNRPA